MVRFITTLHMNLIRHFSYSWNNRNKSLNVKVHILLIYILATNIILSHLLTELHCYQMPHSESFAHVSMMKINEDRSRISPHNLLYLLSG